MLCREHPGRAGERVLQVHREAERERGEGDETHLQQEAGHILSAGEEV